MRLPVRSQRGVKLDCNGLCCLLQDGSPALSLLRRLLQLPAAQDLAAALGVRPALCAGGVQGCVSASPLCLSQGTRLPVLEEAGASLALPHCVRGPRSNERCI